MASTAFLLLGTNLGDRKENIEKGIKLLSEGVLIMERSSLYKTEAWGIKRQPYFLNLVIKVETELSPQLLLSHCLSTETQMGRVRKLKWGERLIDIDILYYDDSVVSGFDLIIPHSGIPDRRFTLVPLVELVPDMVHPELKKSHTQLLKECQDHSLVELYIA